MAVVSQNLLSLDGARSIANMLVVAGAATRSVPAPDEVLSFFEYRFSPFYAELPAGAEGTGATSEGGATVQWLQHAFARAPGGAQRAADEARLSLLRELYDEALATERLQRQRRPQFPWSSSD